MNNRGPLRVKAVYRTRGTAPPTTDNKTMTFEELGVNEPLRRAITDLGFEHPMPVQEKVIPHLLDEDRDVIALAQTGTGKTAAFGLPVIQRIDPSLRAPQALILALSLIHI